MSDLVEKTCPLCAEEMDLTDQHLKPCKCGYEICVWCWHHIMDMSEKDATEGRCPACRTPYNKERIVGMTAKCERLVAEMNMERKLKSHKTKNKSSGGSKQLNSVRVIQRNLAYIMGLPLHLANEDLLQRKEYFGQYGKVLKVSISRTAAGAIQQFANNNCNVYITYSKEEEAVCCIQSVNGFVLEGRPLRACFGTTKYCHSWLRNVRCTNPDCQYLHEVGSQEDSFTKDEIISAHTRSRVQQITCATNNMQRCYGDVLPPPADAYCNTNSASSGKSTSKSVPYNPATMVRGSLPNGTSRSTALPASSSWETSASISQPPPASLASLNVPHKQKPDTCTGSLGFTTAVASSTQVSLVQDDVGKKISLLQDDIEKEVSKLQADVGKDISKLQAGIGKKLIPNVKSCSSQQKSINDKLESKNQSVGTDCRTTLPEISPLSGHHASSTVISKPDCLSAPKDNDSSVIVQPNTANSVDRSAHSYVLGLDNDLNDSADEKNQKLCANKPSMNTDGNKGLKNCSTDQFRGHLMSSTAGETVISPNDVCISRDQLHVKIDSQSQIAEAAICEVGDDLLAFDNQRLNNPEVLTQTGNLSKPFHYLKISNCDGGYFPQQSEDNGLLYVNLDSQILGKKISEVANPLASSIPVMPHEFPDNCVSRAADLNGTIECGNLDPDEVKRKHNGGFEGLVVNVDKNAVVDMGENHIISNILSMDFDSLDESLTSPQSMAKLFGKTDQQQGTQLQGTRSSWKMQNNSKSRFSFARDEEAINCAYYVEPDATGTGQVLKEQSINHDFLQNRKIIVDKFIKSNGFTSATVNESNYFSGSNSQSFTAKPSATRTQLSAPPGFLVPSRTPPPGFTSHERTKQPYVNMPFYGRQTSLLNQYQAPPSGNIGDSVDIEFMDPAILAVGKGMVMGGLDSPGFEIRSNFPPQLRSFENESNIQLLMQKSLALHENQRFVDMGDNFLHHNRIPSRVMEQTLGNNLSPFSQLTLPQSWNAFTPTGHGDSWNEVQSRHYLGMAEHLGTEIPGINKFYTSHEDSNMRMPCSGDL